MKKSPALLLCALATTGLACRDDAPPPSPVPAATAPAETGLRPMTSRDGGAPAGPAGGSSGALPPGHPPIGGSDGAAARGGSAGVSGEITLAPDLKAPANHTLFIIARDARRTIVAVRREERATYPFSFRISAADAMTEGTQFAGPLEITARLSRTGEAMPQAGDLEGVAKGIAVGATDVPITIDTTRQ